ncbi:MAG: hypothetical protein R6V44_12065 [Paracoccaceae bacterium]
MKSAERRAALPDHEIGDFLGRQRTPLVNTIRARLSEFDIVVADGARNIERLPAAAGDLPSAARPSAAPLAARRPPPRDAGEDRCGDRPARSGAEGRSARPTSGDDPGCRRGDGEGDRRDDAGGRRRPLGP